MLGVRNLSTGASAGGVGISVAPGKAPLTVNSATQVKNLNANYLQGKVANAFAQGTVGQIADLTPGSFTGLGSIGTLGTLNAYCVFAPFNNAGVTYSVAKTELAQYLDPVSATGGSVSGPTVVFFPNSSSENIEILQASTATETATATIMFGYSPGHCHFSVQVVDTHP